MTNKPIITKFYSILTDLDAQDARILMNSLQKSLSYHEIDPFFQSKVDATVNSGVPSIMQHQQGMEGILNDIENNKLENIMIKAFHQYLKRRPILSNPQENDESEYFEDDEFENEELNTLIAKIEYSADNTWRNRLQSPPYSLKNPIWYEFDKKVDYCRIYFPDFLDLDYLIPTQVANVLKYFEPILPIYFAKRHSDKTPIADLGVLRKFLPIIVDALGTQWNPYGYIGKYFTDEYTQKYLTVNKKDFRWMDGFYHWLQEKFQDDPVLSQEIENIFLAYYTDLRNTLETEIMES